MSDKQRDREERQHVIEVLQNMVDWMQEIDDIATPERIHALFYAIASIKTDLKYDLLYEETSGQADKQADKPITQNCESCRYYGSRHKVCNYCYKCSLWTEQEPTTKNDLAHNLCGTCINYKCEFQSGIVRTKCAFYMPPTESNCSEIPTGSTTNDNLGVDYLGVDCISREQAIDAFPDLLPNIGYNKKAITEILQEVPPVTPQEPKIGHCKNCKFFELNSWAACGGIPIIVAHEICKAWGNGCKTKEDGYCFLFEPKESEG